MSNVRHVWILRHAKAAKDGPDGDDHSRPLTGRGRRQSKDVAAYLAQRRAAGESVPDLVLSSTAARALGTAEVAHQALASEIALELDRDLYRAGPDDIIERLRLLPDGFEAPMVVGHNPTLHELVFELVDDADGRARLGDGFPTAALAVVAVDIGAWSELRPGGGRLEELFVPSR
jgi:phosphohistidine phosphatase